MDEVLHKIGQPIGEPPPSVYELIIDEHIPFADPTVYGLENEALIRPSDYFITSGDAVEKTKVLERDLWELAGSIRKRCYQLIAADNACTYVQAQDLYRQGIRPKSPPGLKDYEEAVWKAAGCSRKLLGALKKARGVNIFLETEWDSHRLLCIPKNPRRQATESI